MAINGTAVFSTCVDIFVIENYISSNEELLGEITTVMLFYMLLLPLASSRTRSYVLIL